MPRVPFTFSAGSIASAAALVWTRAANYLAKGSRNFLMVGLNKCVGYKGPLLLNGVEGGKQMMSAAESYASLGTGTTAGLGSVFRVLTALFFIGAGAVRYNGLSTGAVATSTLSLRLLENGLYNGATLQAGLAQPSAPSIFVKTAGAGFTGTKLVPGTRSVEIWRIRSSTGAISIASLPSNVVVTASGQTIVITFPLPSSNGDDRWGIASTKAGFGEFGPFYEIQNVTEIAESQVATTSKTDGAITSADQTLTSASSAFVAGDIGKPITVVGAGTHSTITAATNANPVVLTSVAHGLASGATVIITGATGGWTGINGTFIATVTGVDTFSIPVDSTAFGALAGSPIFNPQDLNTTIASLNSATSVELTLAAGTTVSGATFRYGGVVNGVGRSVEFEWTDGQLAGQNLAPIDDFPPPPAIFGGTLNDTGFLDGAYGDQGTGVAAATMGASIVVSLPLKFESWPPDNILFAPQPATALSSRAADGFAYRAGISSLGALIYTGGNPPISFQLRWPNAGCLAPHNMVIAEQGRLYIWTAQHGLARIGDGDEPETDFAIPIWDEVADWNAIEVVMGWDGSMQHVCACHRKLIKPFNSQIDRWGTLLDLTGKIRGNIIAAVTANSGELYLCCNNVRTVSDVTTTNADKHISSPTAVFTADDVGKTVYLTQSGGAGTLTTTIATFTSATQVILTDNVTWTAAGTTTIWIDTTLRLYRFNAGTGMVSEAYTPWIPTDDESDQVFGVGGAVVIDAKANPVVMRLLANGNPANVAREWQIYLPTQGENVQHIYTARPDLINAKSHALYIKITGAAGETSLDSLYSEREGDNVVISG